MAAVEMESYSGRFDVYITCRRIRPGSDRKLWMFAVMPMYEVRDGYLVYSVLTKDLDDTNTRQMGPRIDDKQFLEVPDLTHCMDHILDRIHGSHRFFELIRDCRHENKNFILEVLCQLGETNDINKAVLTKWYADWYDVISPPARGPSAASSTAAGSPVARSAGAASASARPSIAKLGAAFSAAGISGHFVSVHGPDATHRAAAGTSASSSLLHPPEAHSPNELRLSEIDDAPPEALVAAGLTEDDRPILRRMRAKVCALNIPPENISISDSLFKVTGVSLGTEGTSAGHLSEADHPVLKDFRARLTKLGIPAEEVSVSQSCLSTDECTLSEALDGNEPLTNTVRSALSELGVPPSRVTVGSVVTTGIPPSAEIRSGSRLPASAAGPSISTARPPASAAHPAASAPGPSAPKGIPSASTRSTTRPPKYPTGMSDSPSNRSSRKCSPLAGVRSAGSAGECLYVPEGKSTADVSAAYSSQFRSPAAGRTSAAVPLVPRARAAGPSPRSSPSRYSQIAGVGSAGAAGRYLSAAALERAGDSPAAGPSRTEPSKGKPSKAKPPRLHESAAEWAARSGISRTTPAPVGPSGSGPSGAGSSTANLPPLNESAAEWAARNGISRVTPAPAGPSTAGPATAALSANPSPSTTWLAQWAARNDISRPISTPPSRSHRIPTLTPVQSDDPTPTSSCSSSSSMGSSLDTARRPYTRAASDDSLRFPYISDTPPSSASKSPSSSSSSSSSRRQAPGPSSTREVRGRDRRPRPVG